MPFFLLSAPPKLLVALGLVHFYFLRKPLAPPQPLIAEAPLLLRQMTHQRIGKVQVHTVIKGKDPKLFYSQLPSFTFFLLSRLIFCPHLNSLCDPPPSNIYTVYTVHPSVVIYCKKNMVGDHFK